MRHNYVVDVWLLWQTGVHERNQSFGTWANDWDEAARTSVGKGPRRSETGSSAGERSSWGSWTQAELCTAGHRSAGRRRCRRRHGQTAVQLVAARLGIGDAEGHGRNVDQRHPQDEGRAAQAAQDRLLVTRRNLERHAECANFGFNPYAGNGQGVIYPHGWLVQNLGKLSAKCDSCFRYIVTE